MLFIQTWVVQQANLLVKQVYNKIVKKGMKKSTMEKTRCHSPKSWRQALKAPCAKVYCCHVQVLQTDTLQTALSCKLTCPVPCNKPSQDEVSWLEV